MIKQLVDTAIFSFAQGFETKHKSEVDHPEGIINAKKNNCFVAELSDEFMFYSAFVRSFDSSFGRVLENLGNLIAKLFYKTNNQIDSFILPQQEQHIQYLINIYEEKQNPNINDYLSYDCRFLNNIISFKKTHKVDNYFYDENTKEHFLIELKAGGDLDNKKLKLKK